MRPVGAPEPQICQGEKEIGTSPAQNNPKPKGADTTELSARGRTGRAFRVTGPCSGASTTFKLGWALPQDKAACPVPSAPMCTCTGLLALTTLQCSVSVHTSTIPRRLSSSGTGSMSYSPLYPQRLAQCSIIVGSIIVGVQELSDE